jgi:hypothetical protein
MKNGGQQLVVMVSRVEREGNGENLVRYAGGHFARLELGVSHHAVSG